MKYVLDTNICIYIIKRKPESVIQKFTSLVIGNIGVSSVTVAELEYGVMKSSNPENNREALERFLTPLVILDFDYKAAIEYGRIRAELEIAGTPIGSMDLMIAAHVKSLDSIVVTNNEKEFNRVPELKIENWVN